MDCTQWASTSALPRAKLSELAEGVGTDHLAKKQSNAHERGSQQGKPRAWKNPACLQLVGEEGRGRGNLRATDPPASVLDLSPSGKQASTEALLNGDITPSLGRGWRAVTKVCDLP